MRDMRRIEASFLPYSRFTVGQRRDLSSLFPFHCWAEKRPPWVVIPCFILRRRASLGGLFLFYTQEGGPLGGF